jgi:predicted PhzF superfamily epimerase YddE/YHI9
VTVEHERQRVHTVKRRDCATTRISASVHAMKVPYYQIDAFTERTFGGNPAGVCLLDRWARDAVLQQIAGENNLSETAFLVGNGSDWELRWFTPTVEVDLCGHATLAAAFVIFTELGHRGSTVRFKTTSGELAASFSGGVVMLDFPSRPGEPCAAPPGLISGLGHIPREVRKSRDFLALLGSEDDVRALKPEMPQLAELDCLGIIATARGNDVDFVSRFFAPAAGIAEDPVTGSAHCTLIPYWAEKLGKTKLLARQLSRRGGTLQCEMRGERVGIGGRAVLYSRAELQLPD